MDFRHTVPIGSGIAGLASEALVFGFGPSESGGSGAEAPIQIASGGIFQDLSWRWQCWPRRPPCTSICRGADFALRLVSGGGPTKGAEGLRSPPDSPPRPVLAPRPALPYA
jgi:hypothetical protein